MVRIHEAVSPPRVRSTRLVGRALVIGALVVGASCGISSIAPYNPDGGARTGSGGVPAGSGGVPAGTGGNLVASGGQAGTAPALGSGGHSPAGSGGQAGAATTTSGGQPGTSTGGRGGQAVGGSGGGGGQRQTASGGGPVVSTGGASGRGGGPGTGGGVAPACQEGDERCSGNGVQTCGGGQWGTASACGMRQVCTESAGNAACGCKMDPLCAGVGSICADAATIAACAQDVDGCFYKTTTVACTSGTCAGASPSCCMCLSGKPACAVAGSSQVCASGLVCERSAPTVCADADWAQWPMPNGPAAVASGAPNAMSYTDNGDGTVTDKITGLMWQQASFGPSNWAQAVAHCPTLTLGGYKDWRLPTRIELLSLVDYSVVFGTTLMVNSTYFPSLTDAYYWTSTVRANAPSSEAWVVNFTQGGSGDVDMALNTAYELCVR